MSYEGDARSAHTNKSNSNAQGHAIKRTALPTGEQVQRDGYDPTDKIRGDYIGLNIVRRTGVQKPLRTSVIVVSNDWSILSSDGLYKDILGLPSEFQPKVMRDIIEARLELGWLTSTEVVDALPAVEARLTELIAVAASQTYACSPTGEIVSLTHYTNASSGSIFIFLSETEFSSNTQIATQNALLPFHVLLAKDNLQSGIADEANFEHDVAAPHVIAEAIVCETGAVKYLRQLKPDFAPRSAIRSIKDLDISKVRLSRAMSQKEPYITINSTLFSEMSVIVRIEKRSVYTSGPSFLKCTIEEIGARLTRECIAAAFPMFTRREIEIVRILAQGHSLKEVASIVNRAHGTVTIQARSAMQKTDTRSLVALVSLVCQLCL